MIALPESAPTARPARALLRAGAAGACLAGGLVSLACLLVSARAGASALVGTLLAGAALSVGPLLLAASRTMSPPAVMAVAMAGYLATVIVLAAVYVPLGSVTWLSGDQVGLGILAAATGSLAGQMRAVARLRVLAFGNGTQRDAQAPDAGQNGSPASPPRPPH